MGGDRSQQTQQTTKVELSPEQQQLLNMAMPFAQKYAQNQPTLPTTSSVAGFTDPQKQGQTQTLAAGAPEGALSSEASGAQKAQNFLTSGAALDPASNPGLQKAIEGAVRPIEQNFSENILPQIRSGAVSTGQFGGGREGALEGIASQAEQQAIGSTAGSMESANYQNALDQMTKAMGLTPTVQQASLEPGAATSAVGDVQQQLEQQKLTEAFQKFMFPQTEPIMTAEQLAGLSAGIPGGGSTTTGTVNSNLSPMQTALGLGSLGAGLFGGQGMFGGSGAFSSFLPALFAAA
jgi:hypothetical protein